MGREIKRVPFTDLGWAPSFTASAATGVVPGEQFAGGA